MTLPSPYRLPSAFRTLLRVYLPLRKPPASGDQGSRPISLCRAAGMTSYSISRHTRLVLLLKRDRHLKPHRASGREDKLELPARKVRQSNIVDFSRTRGRIEEGEGFLDGGKRIPTMHLIEIDRLNAQTAQRGVQGAAKVRARGAGIVHVRSGSEPGLSRDDEAARRVRAACPPPTEKLFRSAAAIDVGRVDYVAASFEEGVEDGECLLLGRLGPEPHGSKDQVR